MVMSIILITGMMCIEVTAVDKELENQLKPGNWKLRAREIRTLVESEAIGNEAKIELFLSVLGVAGGIQKQRHIVKIPPNSSS